MTLTEELQERLRNDILSGALRPGERLRIDRLKQMYGPSATPLREALTRLAGEWVVESSDRSGFRVAAMSLSDLQDVTRVRVLLECEALRESIARGDSAWEASILAAHHRVSRMPCRVELAQYPEWEALNESFHDSLIAACGSPWILRLRRTVYYAHKRYRMLAIRHARCPEEAPSHIEFDRSDEHGMILEAALERDVDAACVATRRHIETTQRVIVANRLLSESG